jgi:hypothetical protein
MHEILRALLASIICFTILFLMVYIPTIQERKKHGNKSENKAKKVD